MSIKYFKHKFSHYVLLDDETLPFRFLVPRKTKKNIKFPVWLITLVQSRKIIFKVFSLFKNKTDPIDPDQKLVDALLNELRSINKDDIE